MSTRRDCRPPSARRSRARKARDAALGGSRPVLSLPSLDGVAGTSMHGVDATEAVRAWSDDAAAAMRPLPLGCVDQSKLLQRPSWKLGPARPESAEPLPPLFDASKQAEHAASRLASLGAARGAQRPPGRAPPRVPKARRALAQRFQMDELLAELGDTES